MSVDSRHVERVSLRAGRTQDVQRAANTLAEAFRIASLPGDGRPGRLFIRRIELPAFRLDRGASPIAAALTQRVRELQRSAVRISSPRAAKAQAVIATDPIEPLVLALLHAAAGRRLVEWFWPQVDCVLQPGATPQRVAARVWQLLSEDKNAASVVPAAVAAVLDAGPVGGALHAIDTNLGQTLAWRLEAPLLESAHWSTIIERVAPARWHQSVRTAIEQYGGDQRAAWLVTAVAHAARPWGFVPEFALEPSEQRRVALIVPSGERPQAPASPARSANRVEPSRLSSPEPTRDVFGAPAPPVSQAASQVPPAPLDEPAMRGDASAPEVGPSTPVTEAPRPPQDPTPEPERRAQSRWSAFGQPLPTSNGGLLFLLHPLRRLGLDALLERTPALQHHAFGLQLLTRFADHLQINPADPVCHPLAVPELPGDLALPMPPRLDLVPPEWLGTWPPIHETDAFQVWIGAVRFLLEREHELTLETVVQRNAALTCTRTHVDLIFDMDSSDLRIRKAGLDIDPGFVRWFGRVVRFHYVFGGLLDA